MRWDRYPGCTIQTAAPKSSEGARTPEQERQEAQTGNADRPRQVTASHPAKLSASVEGIRSGASPVQSRAMGPAARGSFVVGCPPNVAAKSPKRAAENRGCLQRGARQPKTASRRLSRRGNQCARIGPLRCPQKANTLFSLRSLCDLDVLGSSVLRAPRTARNAPEITPRRPDGPQEGPKKGQCQPKRGPEQPKRARRRPKRPP